MHKSTEESQAPTEVNGTVMGHYNIEVLNSFKTQNVKTTNRRGEGHGIERALTN